MPIQCTCIIELTETLFLFISIQKTSFSGHKQLKPNYRKVVRSWMTLSYETQTMQISSSNLQVKETILAIHASSLLWQMSTWMQQSEVEMEVCCKIKVNHFSTEWNLMVNTCIENCLQLFIYAQVETNISYATIPVRSRLLYNSISMQSSMCVTPLSIQTVIGLNKTMTNFLLNGEVPSQTTKFHGQHKSL